MGWSPVSTSMERLQRSAVGSFVLPQLWLCQQGALLCQRAGQVYTKKGNSRRKNDGQHPVYGLSSPAGLRLFVWKLIFCPLCTFSWKKDYWVIILFFNILSFLKISSPSQCLNSAVEMQILKAVCGRHCTISLALACSSSYRWEGSWHSPAQGIPLHSDSAGGHCSVAVGV